MSTVNLENKKVSFVRADVTPMVLNFIDDKIIDDIKDIKTDAENEMTKGMTLEQKMDLYKKIKNNKTIEQTLKQYEKSNKVIRKDVVEEEEASTNDFSYHFSPVYVAEHKLNKADKDTLMKDFLKKEEIRKKMKERGAIPKENLKERTTIKNVQSALERAKTKVVLEKKNDNKKAATKTNAKIDVASKDSKTNTTNTTNKEDIIDEIDEIALQVFISQNKIDDNLKHIKEDEIFTKDDIKKIKEISGGESSRISLSLRERVNIIQQIKNCYKNAILKSRQDSKIVVNIIIDVKKSGIIDLDSIYIENTNQKDKDFLIALDNVKTALTFCSPLRGMPINKYSLWKKMAFVFDSNNLE
ncbi:MAG: hypothetical protein LBH46_02745 [Rickettsiales bacterium]|nr:hypothetical protein [Rickettsiales bacterium]